MPEKLVGRWELAAATLTAAPKDNPARLEPKPRSDYARTLEVTPQGCFTMSTALQEATLGRSNSLEVRAWGSVVPGEKDLVTLGIQDGQAIGHVCGKPRIFGLSKGKFQKPRYHFSVEDDALTLTVDDAASTRSSSSAPSPET